MRIAVLGAGAWGTALAVSLAARHEVTLWGRDASQLAAIAAAGENRRYLPGVSVPTAVALTGDLSAASASRELLLVAVPTAALRATLAAIARPARCVALACKGFEPGTGRLPHQVAGEVLGERVPVAILSGPTFADEVARGLPAAATLACTDALLAREIAQAIHGARLRVYSGDDVVGVAVAGATKNVMAIAAGICDGMGLGLNARAALITRGLAEVARLGRRLGGRVETFMGLAGAGDLILTCTGDLSRNRRVGRGLAAGDSLDTVLARLGHVAEGVQTAREIDRTADGLAIDMPITRAVRMVLDGECPPAEAVSRLLERDPKAEF